MRLDIFGEVVVTLGTTPRGGNHETVTSRVVADILGITPDDVRTSVRDTSSYWNSHAGFSGTYASQFAVPASGGEGRDARAPLADPAARRRAFLGADGPVGIVLGGGMAKRRDMPEAAHRSWPAARSST